MSANTNHTPSGRIRFLGIVLAGLFVIGLAYSLMLQIGYPRDFELVARRQHLDSIIPLPGRGRVLDANCREVAFTQSSFTVSVYPTVLRCSSDRVRQFKRQTQAAWLLSRYGGQDLGRTWVDIRSRKSLYEFDHALNYDDGARLKQAVRSAGLDDALQVQPRKSRLYAYGDTFGSVLGYAVNDSGKTGIEDRLDPMLTGSAGKIVVQRDGLGNRYRFPAYPDLQPVNGADVRLTIDLDFQRAAFQELQACVDSFAADGGSAVVLDCRTGEVKALTDYPYRDPRILKKKPDGRKEPDASFRCRAVSESFEPGSAFKPITGLAALESQNANEFRSMTFNTAAGVIEIGGKKIHDVHPSGPLDFPGIFIKSSNVGLTMLSRRLDRGVYYQVMHRLGLGQPTGIELPYEDPGYLDPEYRRAPRELSELRVANNSFGQGVRVTLLQLAAAYAAIANHGRLMKPFLVSEIRYGDSVYFRNRPLEVRQAVSREAADYMSGILHRVVTEGTGTSAATACFEVCGKTGTAEKALPGRGYADGQTIASFAGYFPWANPQYVIVVSVDNPRIGRFAGTIVCPTFRRIAERIYGFEPERFATAPADAGVALK